jgi:DNA primase
LANFSEEIIREVLAGTDIVDILSAHLPLKLSGKNYRTLCPFHSEKTPSFTVSPEKQIYHCFGCGEGGNALTFLMKYERLSFPEAVRHLADRAGIRLPEKRHERSGGSSSPKLDLYEVNRLAGEFFGRQLRGSPEGQKARDYLKSRGIGEEVWDKFLLGYAPASWDSLLRHLGGKGKPFPLLESAGLIVPGRRAGAFHDRFRDRLMIPILDPQGRVLGFGGRAFSEGESKYINSPTSPIYNKGETLYGLNLAGQRIREKGKAFIVEGYFDLISMHCFGWENAVASLGTSLTSGQAHLLKRYTDWAVLLFDSDPAGIKASVRSIEVLMEQGFFLKVAKLPPGYDPDSLLQREGQAAMEEVLRDSPDWLDFMWELKGEEGAEEGIREEVHKVRGVLPILSKMRDRLSRTKYLAKLAEKANLREDLLRQEMKEMGKGEERSLPASAPPSKSYPVEERQALEIALSYPERRDRWAELLDQSEISDPELRGVFTLYFQHRSGGEEAFRQAICQDADEEVRRLCTGIWAKGGRELGNEEAAFADCVRKMREKRERTSKQELRRKIHEAEQAGDSMAVSKLIREHPSLRDKHHLR